jgi:hypothetical protein
MRLLTLIAALFTLAAAASAQSLDRLNKSFDQRCEQAATARDAQLDKLNASYAAALQRLLEKTKASGKLDAALPVQQEIEALKQGGGRFPEIPAGAPGELGQLRAKYQDGRHQILKTHATTLVDLADKMDAALKAREAELTKAGKLEDAVAARLTREGLARDRDFLDARDLLKLGGAAGKGKPALQLRRYGDNLEVLVYYDRYGKVTMDSPVENVREKTGEGRELGDTKAKTLGEFVGAKGYTVDPYVAYEHTFDGKDLGGMAIVYLAHEPAFSIEGEKGVKISYSTKQGTTPYAQINDALPPKGVSGTYRVSIRTYIPKANRVINGIRLSNDLGTPLGRAGHLHGGSHDVHHANSGSRLQARAGGYGFNRDRLIES